MLQAVKKRKEDEGFVVDSDKKASWCLRKIKHMKQKQQHNEELAQEEIEDIREEIEEVKQWCDAENKKLQNSIDRLVNKLHNYAFKLREDDPDLKTHKLPFGKLQFRKQRPSWKYEEDKLLEFAKSSLEEAVKTEEKVDKRKLKKKAKVVGDKAVLVDTGEIIEGVIITPRPEKFRVKVDV